jgi:RND family efflux transporter MFP subunit
MRGSRRGGRLLGAGGLVLSLGLVACEGRSADGSASADADPAAAPGPPTLEVVRVVDQPVDVTLDIPGELKAYQEVAIHPRVTAFVQSIRVDRGSRVRAGEVLAVLEAPELEAERSEAQSKLQGAQAQLGVAQSRADAEASTYDKLETAASTPGVVAGNDLVHARKAVEAAEGQVAAARDNVEAARQALNSVIEMKKYLRITAPFAGVITERNVHPGALVGPGGSTAEPIVRLVDDTRLRLVVPVPEAYSVAVEPGTEITFAVSSYPGQSFTGRVARIARAIDVGTRTMAVEIDVVNDDGRLSPGAFCRVRWPVRRTGSSLWVPSRSVASTTDRTFVVRVRDGKTEWVDVETGLGSGTLVEVFGALEPGDQVAARGTDEIAPDTAVLTREAPPAA